jgi:hypothetical protein
MKTSLNVRGRGGVSRGLAAVVALLVAVMAGFGLVAGSASAHSGGKAIVLVEDLTIAPSGDSYVATAKLADYDGGGPLKAVDAKLKGAGFTSFESMKETANPGTYELALPKAKPGPVEVTLDIRTLPGGTPVTAFKQTYPGELVAGQALALTSGKVVSGGGGGSNTGMIVGVAGAVLLVAVLYGLFSVRKKSAVPARAK